MSARRGGMTDRAATTLRAHGRSAGGAMIALLAATALFALTACGDGDAPRWRSRDAFTAHLDTMVPQLMDRYAVPGASIAIVEEGEVVWTAAYGLADVEDARPMTVDSVCRAQSISKSLTAWGVMRLAEAGLVDLDRPVQDYLGGFTLPDTPYAEDDVTVRGLLSQTAGMPLGDVLAQYEPGAEMPTLREDLAAQARLFREPGVGFFYSNPGFDLLEIVIEEASGRPYAEYMRADVLEPLGMHDSTFEWDERLRPDFPIGYDLRGEPVPPYVYPAKASGGLLAPVEDLARFAAAEMTGEHAAEQDVLSPASISAMHAAETDVTGIFGAVSDSYGLGHFIERLPDGRTSVWHGGQGNGWMTHFQAVPSSGDGIVILTNSQRSWPMMGRILGDWATYAGLGSVKFTRIVWAENILWAIAGLIVLASIAQLGRLARDLRRGRRRVAPFSATAGGTRALLFALGAVILGALAWSAAQPYLLLSSVLPFVADWATAAAGLGAVTLIASALIAPTDGTTTVDDG